MADAPAAHAQSFVRAVAVRFGADVGSLALRLALLGILTRKLSASDYGAFSQAITTATLLVPVFSLRLGAACVRFFPSLGEDRRLIRHTFAMTLVIMAAVSTLGVGVAMIAKGALSEMIFGSDAQAELVPLLAGYALAQTLTSHAIEFYRAVNATQTSSLLNVARAALNVSAVFAALTHEQHVSGALIALLACDISIGLVLLIAIEVRSRVAGNPSDNTRRHWTSLAPYLRYALPLVPYTLCVVANAVADRYFITHFLGIDRAGAYALSYGIVSSAMVMSNSIAFVMLPHLTRLWERGDPERARTLLTQGQNLSLYFSIPIACGLTVVYPTLVSVIATDSFTLGRPSIAAIAFGHVFLGLYSVNSYAVDLAKQSIIYLEVAGAALVLNTLLNWVLIPRFQIQGAALATAITYLAQWLIIHRRTPKLAGFSLPISAPFLLSVVAGALAMVLGVAWIDLGNRALQLAVSIALGASIYLAVTGALAGSAGRSKVLAMFSRAG